MKFWQWIKGNIGSVLVHVAAVLATLEAVTNTINLPPAVRVGLVTASGVVVAAERVVQTIVGPNPAPAAPISLVQAPAAPVAAVPPPAPPAGS